MLSLLEQNSHFFWQEVPKPKYYLGQLVSHLFAGEKHPVRIVGLSWSGTFWEYGVEFFSKHPQIGKEDIERDWIKADKISVPTTYILDVNKGIYTVPLPQELAYIHGNMSTTNLKPNLDRGDTGQFLPKSYGEKKLRSMKLTDHAWSVLEAIALETGKTRTDVVEDFTRMNLTTKTEEEIILKALERFIEKKRSDYGNNPSQRGKEFSTDSRGWDVFKEFYNFIKEEVGTNNRG